MATLGGVVIYLKNVSENDLAEKDATIQFKLPDTNATVFIDGKEQPALSDDPVVRLKLKPGKHQFTVLRDGKEVFGKEFEVKAGDITEWGTIPIPPPGAPSPWDVLDPAKILESEHFPWHPKELVAVIGSHAWQGLGDPFWRKTANGDQLLACAHFGDTLRVTEAATGKVMASFTRANASDSYVSPDGKTVGLRSNTGVGWTWCLWDLETEKQYPLFTGMHDNHDWDASVRIALSPNGKYAATVQRSTTIIWDAATGKPLEQIKPKVEDNNVDQSVAFLPDSTGVVWVRSAGSGAWASVHSELVLYDVAKRKELNRSMTLKGTGGYWESLNISPDGRTVALAGAKVSKNANNAEKIDFYVDAFL